MIDGAVVGCTAATQVIVNSAQAEAMHRIMLDPLQ
jgi:hypothetical protein